MPNSDLMTFFHGGQLPAMVRESGSFDVNSSNHGFSLKAYNIYISNINLILAPYG